MIRKTQKDAESESESDDSSSSSDSGTIFSSLLFNIDSDKDKKKGGNIKRASGQMMGGPGSGGNAGTSNLNTMWKRNQ
jgi:hypothetical protein